MQEILATNTCEKWLEILNKAGVPAAAVQDIPGLFKDPQVKNLKLFVSMKSAEGKTIEMCRLPFTMSEFNMKYRSAPRIGEHTEEVLTELAGLSHEEIEKLAHEGVVTLP